MTEQEMIEGTTEMIDRAIESFLGGLSKQEVKLSVGDIVKLLDLRKELARNEVREVRVQWVESNPAPSVINS
jgi:hypothetical protein